MGILLVEDSEKLTDLLITGLSKEGFGVDAVSTVADCKTALTVAKFAAVILDLGLPDGDGRQVCQQMRTGGLKAPIIMLTGADSENDTIQGLDAGASDYVTKPFRLGVLIARIKAQLRQHEQSDDALFAIGPYRFRPASKLLMDPEKKIGRAHV